MRLGSWDRFGGVLLVLSAIACEAEITFPPGAGGAGGDGAGVVTASTASGVATGQGGGPADVFTIELALVASAAPFDDGRVDPAAVTVFVGAPDGLLTQSLWGDQLPVQVEVEAGDVVGYRWNDSVYNVLRTYRITADVVRIEETVGEPSETCDVEPMQITVTLPALLGATTYYVAVDGETRLFVGAPGEHTFEVVDCDGSFDLFAYAGAGSEGEMPVGYEVIQDIAFLPGGRMAIPLALASTKERVLAIEAGPLDGADAVWGGAGWSYGDLELPSQYTQQLNAAGSSLYAPSLIAPGARFGVPRASVSVTYGPDAWGACHVAQFKRQGQSEAVLSFDPHRLARAKGTPEGAWELVERGDLGDVISISRVWADFDLIWVHHEDPQGMPVAAVLPELPQADSWPTGTPDTENVQHEDILERDGYAAAISGGDSRLAAETHEHRITSPCY